MLEINAILRLPLVWERACPDSNGKVLNKLIPGPSYQELFVERVSLFPFEDSWHWFKIKTEAGKWMQWKVKGVIIVFPNC